MSYKLPELPYPYDGLEPVMDTRTMEIHHRKHHAGYVEKLNKTLEEHHYLEGFSLDELLKNLPSIPLEIRTSIRNNGGGHFNHSFFWKVMRPQGGGEPRGDLRGAIERFFGSFEAFKDRFSEAAITFFGSGWAWLAVTRFGELFLLSTPNQETPLTGGLVPILGIDLWEHVYYLKYQNRRSEYVQNWWKVVNWEAVAENYREAMNHIRG